MKIYTYSLGELQANCYLLENEGKTIIIDPADEGSFLLEEIQRRRLELVGLFATHGHFDHVMAVGEIQMSFPIPFSLHKKDQFLIDRLENTAEHFLGYKPVVVPPSKVVHIIEKEVMLPGFSFKILETPGHTPGSVCFYFPEDASLFTGDTLFMGAVGRTDLSYSNKKDLWNSIKKLLALPEETTIYPGHGESSYIGQEKTLLG